jgi:hypothetical protein
LHLQLLVATLLLLLALSCWAQVSMRSKGVYQHSSTSGGEKALKMGCVWCCAGGR